MGALGWRAPGERVLRPRRVYCPELTGRVMVYAALRPAPGLLRGDLPAGELTASPSLATFAGPMDLFRHSASKRRLHQPLAERMRPITLEELVGQEHLLGQGKLLGVLSGTSGVGRKAKLASLILWGPPGTGKTSLARLLARREDAELEALSAVSAGVAQIREVVARAADRRDQFGRKTILFLDEIHRFSKSQQDALLPHVEAGTVTLIGATTENPSFEVNAALLSRCPVVRLERLSEDSLRVLARRALTEPERGLGELGLSMSDEVCEQLVQNSAGDARRLLGALELAAQLTAASGRTEIEPVAVEEAMQQKTLLYDKAGDEHYGVVSAFIKSLRGSDPDAACYWMTRMLEAGEDPKFILRRMVIFASEDIGNADPQALSVVTSALASFQFIGLPEGVLPMTQAAVYLATAPKSNSALTTYGKARKAVREHGALAVPKKLRNAATELQKQMGYGSDYRYPHNFSGNYVAETYLPEELEGETFYEPSDSGYECEIAERLRAWRSVKDESEP